MALKDLWGPIDAANHVTQMGDRGRQRGESTFLNKLLGQAYNSPDAAGRGSALQRLAGGGQPQAAMAAEASFADVDDRKRKTVVEIARIIHATPEAMRPAVFEQHKPQMAAIGLDVQNRQYDAEVGALVGRLASMDRGQSNLTPSVASVEDAFSRGVISKPEYDKGMRIALDLAPGASAPSMSFVEQYDPATGRTYKVPRQTRGVDYTGDLPSLGADNAPPSASMPRPVASANDVTSSIAESANRLIEAGYDPQTVEAWVMEQGQQHTPAGMEMRSGANASAPTRSPLADAGTNGLGGGAILSGPGNAERAEQQRREAAAGAQGRIEGERSMGPNFGDETTLRKEYETRIAEPRSIVDAYRRVEGAARESSAAGDLSLIFAYMKMLDPGSVVREGEFANAQNAAGVPDQVWNLYNRALSGERLNPNQRQDFLGQATKLRDQAQTRIEEANSRYRGLAPSYNMDPNRIAPEQGRYQRGEVIETGGKRWRVVGGDPNDPDVEEVR